LHDICVYGDSADPAALSHAERQKREAEAMAQGMPVEHRNDCAPQAILQCRLVTAARANPSPATSPEHVITFGGRR
jgi:hypothetical protein